MTSRAIAGRPHDIHILEEELFRHVLIGERKRADRSNQRLVVMMLAARDLRSHDATFVWKTALEAVTAHLRQTDLVGWIARRAAIGVILHEATTAGDEHAQTVEARVRHELDTHLDAATAARFSIRFHVLHPCAVGEQDAAAIDPLVFREPRPAMHRHAIYDRLKRVLDLAGSLSLLAILLPLLLLIAALVKLKSPGPVFFRQVRIGRGKKPFEMLKFRTMHVNADPKLHHEFVSRFINASGQAGACSANGLFKLVDDPRVTPVGALLRRTSLDELPQLWNVVRGDMSLVGPRPPLPYEVEQYKPWHTRRVIEAIPGITGLWQVGGRSRTTFEEMVRLDLRYARTRTVSGDIRILLATPKAVFSGKGAC